MLGSKILVPALLVLLIGGCPKRQTTPRVVYIQQAPSVSPPGARPIAQATPETLVIQEPETTPPTDSSPPVVANNPAPATQPAKKPKAPVKLPHDSTDKVTADVPAAVPPPVAETPLQLEPEGSEVQETEIGKHLDNLGTELTDLEHRANLSEDQHRTLDDAKTFRTQSLEALRQRDLLRAKQLALKADLLIKAVQGQP